MENVVIVSVVIPMLAAIAGLVTALAVRYANANPLPVYSPYRWRRHKSGLMTDEQLEAMADDFLASGIHERTEGTVTFALYLKNPELQSRRLRI